MEVERVSGQEPELQLLRLRSLVLDVKNNGARERVEYLYSKL